MSHFLFFLVIFDQSLLGSILGNIENWYLNIVI